MKNIFIYILLIGLFASCSKSDDSSSCNLTGTWQQVIKLPDEPEQLAGLKMELLQNGSMKMAGITGFSYRIKDKCGTLEYWATADKSVTAEMSIIKFDGT